MRGDSEVCGSTLMQDDQKNKHAFSMRDEPMRTNAHCHP